MCAQKIVPYDLISVGSHARHGRGLRKDVICECAACIRQLGVELAQSRAVHSLQIGGACCSQAARLCNNIWVDGGNFDELEDV